MVEPAPEELSALLPCLDEIYESLNSVDTQNEIDTTRGSSQNEASTKKHKVRRRTADSLPYSTAAQRRKKEELCALRLEAQRLSVKLAHLVQKESAGNKANAEHEELKWRGRAIIECGNRVSSEQTNQKLKAILLQQFKVFQSARKLLGKSGVLEVDAVVPAMTDFFAIGFHTKERNSATTGDWIEINSITPLSASVQDATDILWRCISNRDNDAAAKTPSFARERNPQYREETCENSCITSHLMDSADSDALYVDAVSTFRKYRQQKRTVIVGSMRWLLPTEGLEFGGEYWSLVSPSPTNPSTIRFCYRLHLKSADAPVSRARLEIGVGVNNKKNIFSWMRGDRKQLNFRVHTRTPGRSGPAKN
ncbi:hypothetical protein ON010_g16960 [Phytophthora cinnamomi]|nr:hypothetical protein ON010_g16960 [Phytophthora cinnamomi]